MKRIFLLCSLLISICGCLPKENPVAPYPRGNSQTKSVSIGKDYATQVFVDLSADSTVLSRKWDGWDLELESSSDGWHIWLNEAKSMSAAITTENDFTVSPDIKSLSFIDDAPNGNKDSTAIGNWCEITTGTIQSKKNVFVIDRGFNAAGKSYGKIKFQILSANETSYTFRFAKLDGTDDQTITVPKDKKNVKTLFSFEIGGVPQIVQPDDYSWDIVFTKYTHIFRDPEYIPYSVTGALTNTFAGVAVAEDTTTPYSDITTDKISTYSFSTDADVIGYDWKIIDISAGLYSIRNKITYIIRDRKGFYWKLHFLDFYNEHGERGTPKYEFQKI